jgi:hypothetical protein
MDTIRHTSDKLEFISSLSPIIRIILALFGFFPLLAPYELLVKPDWPAGVSIAMLFMLAISLGAVGISLFLFAAAVLGRSQHFEFDAARRVVIYRFKTAVNPAGKEVYDFAQIESLVLKVHEWDSGPNSYDICLNIRGRREMTFGNFASQAEAERYLAILQNMTQAFS